MWRSKAARLEGAKCGGQRLPDLRLNVEAKAAKLGGAKFGGQRLPDLRLNVEVKGCQT